jgi:hypothetical protein
MIMSPETQERILTVIDEILSNDTEGRIKNVIVWPDETKPCGAGAFLLQGDPEDEDDGEVNTILTENETEARDMLAVLNKCGPGTPLVSARN